MSWEEPAQVRAEGYDYDHELLVALPPSYHTSPERSYPVLWSMDGAMAFATMEPLLKGDRFLDFLVERLRPLLGEQYRMADDHTLWGHSAGGAYAAEHDDLDAKVFFGMADGEINNPGLSAQRLVSRTSLLAENLRLRQYPSLDLRTRLYADRDHITVMPLLIADGLQHVIADLPAPPW